MRRYETTFDLRVRRAALPLLPALAVLALAARGGEGSAEPAPPAALTGAADVTEDADVAPAVPRAALERSVRAGLDYLREARNPDGSFGQRQQRLQTGLAILAFLSSGATPRAEADSPVPAACRWLLDNTTEEGFLGDGSYPMESNAVAALALSEAVGMLPETALDRSAAVRVEDALRYALRIQDRAVGAAFYGGWKATLKDKNNDRRVTAWYLLFLHSRILRGERVSSTSLKRALEFMEGSQKVPAGGKSYERADVGGFSYDAAGLPVVSVTGAGLACLSLYDREAERRDLALAWMARNRPIWYGPNFYYTNFFAARGFARERARGGDARRQADAYRSRIWNLLREHQTPEGSFQLPPGNAENTLAMGKTYATAMAILILNAGRELMPVDATE